MPLFPNLGSVPTQYRYQVMVAERDHNFQAFSLGSLVFMVVSVFYLLEIHLGSPWHREPWHFQAYRGLFIGTFLLPGFFILLFRKIHQKVSLEVEQGVILTEAVLVLMLTTALTWMDLYYGKEYMGITTGLIGVNILLSASTLVYLLLGVGTLVFFTAGLYLLHPGFRMDIFLPVLISVLLFTSLGLLIQSGRRKNILLTLHLQTANEELKEISFRDPLTGVRNRRFLLEYLEQQVSLEKRHRHGLSILLLDLDHFKKVNDTLGHPVGDSVLKHAAKITGALLRESDVLARYGGEEFLAVLPHTALKAGLHVAERIRKTIESQSFIGLSWTQTVSMGVAQYTGEETLEEFITRADKALYAAKNQGRNQVVGA